MKNKIVIAFFVIGMGLSLPGGFLAGNPISYILIYSLVSSMILAGLVFGLLTFLETKVPEFMEFLRAVETGEDLESHSSEEHGEGGSAPPSTESFSSGQEGDKLGSMESSLGSAPPPELPKSDKPKNGKFGDHIMIDNIPIKNEPKLMAEAIRTMMAQDDPGTPSS